MTEDKEKLKGSFGDKGTNVNQIAYGHPYADTIIEGAKKVLKESETGKILINVQEKLNIPVHVLKGNGDGGFSPDMRIIFLQVPGKQDKASPEVIMQFIKALREADQELAGFQAPDPKKDVVKYAGFMHARNMDSIIHICKVIKELTNSSYFSDLLDTLPKLGLNEVYQAYVKGASKEEIYHEYATAYENRGR